MTDQPNDIAAECEKRMDAWESEAVMTPWVLRQLKRDCSRYAAHMRRQQAEIEKLRALVRDAIPLIRGDVKSAKQYWKKTDEWVERVLAAQSEATR